MKKSLVGLLSLVSLSAFSMDCTSTQADKRLDLTVRLNVAQIKGDISDTRAWLAELGRQKAERVNAHSCSDYLEVYEDIVEDLLKH